MSPKHDPSDLFRILGATARLRIIELLRQHGSMGVTDLADKLGVTPAAISQHLRLMRQSGLVTKERDGYRVPYSLDVEGLASCCSTLVDACSCDCHDGQVTASMIPSTCCGNETLEELEERKTHLNEALKAVNEEIRQLKRSKRQKAPGQGTTSKRTAGA